MSKFDEMLNESINRMADENGVDKIELLPHNQMLYDQIEEKIKEGYKNIFYSEGTGLGKSFIFMRLVQDYFEGMNILYITPKISIWTNLIRYNEFKTLNANIEMRTFASFNTYDKSDCEFYDVVFVDECHHMLSDIQGNNVRILCRDMNALGKFSFGFTATPYYQDTYVDEACFDCSCFGLDVFEAVEAGIFKKIKLAVAGIDLDSIPEEYKARYSIVGTEPLLNRILKEHSDIQRWLAYFSSKAELECAYSDLRELFPGYKILKLYTGIDEDEDHIINQFEEYDGRVILLSVSKLLEGVHLKNVGGILLYRNTCELSTYMQMYGRLCDMKNKSVPLFLDVTNSIINLTGISSFKSNRYLGLKREFSIKDFLDVDSIDYWTVELSELLGSLNNTFWTEEEDNIIYEKYPVIGLKVLDLLPNRTKKAVYKRAHVLGVKCIDIEHYADWEDEIIRREYPTYGRSICAKLNNRSPASVRQRAGVLGVVYLGEKPILDEEMELFIKLRSNGYMLSDILEEINKLQCNINRGIVRDIGYIKYMSQKSKVPSPSSYTEYELGILKKQSNEPTRMHICGRLLNRTYDVLANKFKKNYGPVIPYTIKEWTTIRDNMDLLPLESLVELVNENNDTCIRTAEGIQDHINVIKGTFKYNIRWTDEEIHILRNEYTIKGIEYIQQLLFFRPKSSIVDKLSELGIKREGRIEPKTYDYMFSTDSYKGVDISSSKSLAEFSGVSPEGALATLRRNNWTAKQYVDYILENTYKGYYRNNWVSSLVKNGYPENIIKRLSKTMSMEEIIDIMLSGKYKDILNIPEYKGVLLKSPRAVSLQLGISTSCWDKYKRKTGNESVHGFAEYWYNRLLEIGRFDNEEELQDFIKDKRKEHNL